MHCKFFLWLLDIYINSYMSQGTPAFMAITLLLGADADTTHYSKYDFESLMYVTLFCATMLKGPYNSWRMELDFSAQQSTPMREWFDLHQLEGTYKQMGHKKVSHMEIFESSIIVLQSIIICPSSSFLFCTCHLSFFPISMSVWSLVPWPVVLNLMFE